MNTSLNVNTEEMNDVVKRIMNFVEMSNDDDIKSLGDILLGIGHNIKSTYENDESAILKKCKDFEIEHGRPYMLAVDFDGTLCTDAFPQIGKPRQKVIEYVLLHQKAGAHLGLWTCRTGKYLEDAVVFTEDHGIVFNKINDHSDMARAMYDVGMKIMADEYLDDKSKNPNTL